MTIDLPNLSIRIVYALTTLYMLLILFRWLAAYLEFDVDYGRYRWISRLTDPLLNRVRAVLPSLGPADFAPPAVVLTLWIARTILIGSMFAFLQQMS